MSNILVIDDDATVRRTLRLSLERAGHQVRDAEDGAAGLRAFRAARPDLVVTDLLMPTMDGIEMIQAMRAEDADVPILAISGGGSIGKEGPLADARLLGANAAMAKPFSVHELQATVAELLARESQA